MNARQILGLIAIATPFVALFIFMVKTAGVKETLVIFLAVFGTIILFLAGIILLHKL